MLTESHRSRQTSAVTALPLIAAVAVLTALSACSSSSSSGVTPSPSAASSMVTPSASSSASSIVSAAELDRIDTELSALTKDPALTAAAQAAKDLRSLRQIKADADQLTKQASALKTSGCGPAATISTSAAGLAQQATQLLPAVPNEVATVQKSIATVATRTKALQATISQLTTKLSAGGDPTALTRLQSSGTSAALLAGNVQGAQALLTTAPGQYAKVTGVGTELGNVQANVRKRCG